MGIGWTRVDPTVTMRFRIRGTPLDLGHVIGQQTWYDETRWAWTTESRKSGTRNHANLNPTGRTSRSPSRTIPTYRSAVGMVRTELYQAVSIPTHGTVRYRAIPNIPILYRTSMYRAVRYDIANLV
ncbi:hypothetical protein GW17_00027519 [Ensete ventricosum]|nr:hypothetical protein GW17_00027519 [Ensete ventricosum]